MSYTSQPTERVALLAVHSPGTRQVATHVSDWVNVAKYPWLKFQLKVGSMGASATVNAKLQQASAAAGTGVKDITGKAIVALTQAGSDQNKNVAINLQTEELDVNGGFEYVRFSVTVGVADCVYDATLEGFDSRYAPVPTSLYDEVVS